MYTQVVIKVHLVEEPNVNQGNWRQSGCYLLEDWQHILFFVITARISKANFNDNYSIVRNPHQYFTFVTKIIYFLFSNLVIHHRVYMIKRRKMCLKLHGHVLVSLVLVT